MEKEKLAQNIASVRKNIADAAKRVGRDPEEVTLIAVTKTVDAETAVLAAQCGVSDVGENRVQEFLSKRDALSSEINVHLIGQLQRNKVKYIITDVSMIHSVDRLSLAEEIERRAGACDRRVKVLIEVNFDPRTGRGGVLPEELGELAHQVASMPHIDLCGLMCVAPLEGDKEAARAAFRRLRELRDGLVEEGLTLPHLSMGMSHDYVEAVEEGATMVRVGTTIFGPRA